ncbi:MAG TPA: ATP-binding protein, partial [Candidatus Sulfotelmatobacter sp.]|nr:ATP-binding protein [Candidatus Sulfotelmatobacter sp.]
GERRRVLALSPSPREMLAYGDGIPRPVSEVVRDVNFSFAVGEALHDRRDMWHEPYLPAPDRLLRFHLMPIMAETGEPMLVLATVEDITRQRYLETVRRDFVANVSHELRTPIASINLLVETLQNGALNDPAAAEHFLHRIEVETRAMAMLVEDLLELSRLESGTLSLMLEPVGVRAMLENVVSRLAPAAQEKSVDLGHDVQDGEAQVVADPKRIEQVLMNLVHNAVKFTPAGGHVMVRATRQGRGVQIEVADTGVGMDAGEASRIFERFYKVDKGRNRADGAGLGLAIVRHLLELHGSRLQVVSEVGRGSRFSFALPLADESRNNPVTTP